MNINFGEFRYQISKQLLYKEDELMALKRNQAALLDFFLADVDSVHSKYDILDALWTNQEVSQQVVFQTISELRSIIGSSAIRTFSGKGYKWNLPIEINESYIPIKKIASKQPDTNKNTPVIATTKKQNRKYKFKIFILVFFVISLWASFFLNQKHKPINLTLLTAGNSGNSLSNLDIVQQAINQLDKVSLSYLPSKLQPSQAFASPSFVFERSNIATDDWLVWSDIFSSKAGAFLHYGLSSGQVHWQGYVYAESPKQLPVALAKRIQELISLGFFSKSLKTLDINEIKSMLTIAPDDPDILLIIADHFDKIGHYDVAISYLQKLLKLRYPSVYTAQAHWKIASIYKTRGQHSQAHHSLDAMKQALSGSPVWPLYFKYVETKAWLAYGEAQYQDMNQILEDALKVFNLAQQNNLQRIEFGKIDPLVLFKFHILYSILSKKTLNDSEKYHHLNQAQALLIKHNLDESNLAIVFYHFALFSQHKKNDKQGVSKQKSDLGSDTFLVYIKRILELPKTSDNYWIHDSAFEMLVKHYITEQEFETARELFPSQNLSPKQLYLKADLLRVQNKERQALSFFEAAFEQARIKYDTRTGIDAALMLYHLSNKNSKTQSEYRAYLESNANKDWLIKKLKAITAPLPSS
jgi:DNA-binding winged helix-turn-helix (wHTH) protein